MTLAIGLGALVVLVLIRLMASVYPRDSGLVIGTTGGRQVVISVPVGGMAWLAGVRPGGLYVRWQEGSGGDVMTASGEIGVPDAFGTWPWPTAALAVVLVGAVLVTLWFAPMAGRMAMVLVAAFVTNDLLGAVAVPAGLLVLLVPALALTVHLVQLGPGSRLILGASALACVAIITVMAVDPDALSWDTGWWWASTTPASAAFSLAVVGLAVAGVRQLLQRRPGQPLTQVIVSHIAAGREALRLAEETSRDRHARWLHDSVMPRLTEGILAVEAGDARTTSSTLRSLAADLREEVSEGQLAILEWGGIAASLEGAVGAMEAKGLSASLTVQDLGGDPPWPVQIAAWRVAQEALDNALAHASADSIAIVAAIGARQLSIEIADDGVGVDAMTLARARRSGHIGVVSMLDRAREVGALVSIAENRPSGTVIRFRWPR